MVDNVHDTLWSMHFSYTVLVIQGAPVLIVLESSPISQARGSNIDVIFFRIHIRKIAQIRVPSHIERTDIFIFAFQPNAKVIL